MTLDLLKGSPLEQSERVRVGCATWSIPPASAARFAGTGSHLQRYAQVLNCSEINSSFRRVHRAATWKRWASSVPPDFRFSVKMPRAITHDAKLKCSSEIVMEFVQQIQFLNGRLGPLLLQTPPSLEFESKYVSDFLLLLRECYSGDVVCEPRHSSWFTDGADKCLQDFLVARVAADPPCVPAAASPGGLRTLAYFRLHGSPRTYYSRYEKEFVKLLAQKAEKLAMSARVWCIFDNTASGCAIENAMELKAEIAKSKAA
jgi:uncharacterized protein YecE (DUF72 family)